MKNENLKLTTLSQFYQFWVLDMVVESAISISKMLASSPAGLKGFTREVATNIRFLADKEGHSPDVPNKKSRGSTYRALFGASCLSAIPLRKAVETVVNQGRFGNDSRVNHSLLETAQVAKAEFESIDLTGYEVLSSLFKCSVNVLSDKSVCAVLGIEDQLPKDWPLSGFSSGGAKLIVEINQRHNESKYILEQGKFFVLQRIAKNGALAIEKILKYKLQNNRKEINELCEVINGWTCALQDLLPMTSIIRAWREPEYRNRLTSFELSLVPNHPSGDASPFDGITDFAVSQTCTTGCEVCCCGTVMDGKWCDAIDSGTDIAVS